jgi:hypothetical protein
MKALIGEAWQQEIETLTTPGRNRQYQVTTRCLQTASTLFFITKDGARIALNFIKSTGDFVKQFKDFIANFNSAEVGRKLAAMSEDRRKAFFEDFRDRAATVGAEFDAAPGMVGAWEKLLSLGNTPSKSWIRIQSQLLKKMSEQTDEFQDKVVNYYRKHNSNADINSYPGTSSYTGQYYDEFGHPDFTNDVPLMEGGKRAIYQPPNGIKGSSADLVDANDWALRPVENGGGGFNPSNFRRKGTRCEVKDKDGNWIECTWHHHQDGKTLIPVPSHVHSRVNAAHIGGVQVYNEGIIGFFDSPVFN